MVESELDAYGEGLEGKPRLVALNKVDLADDELVAGFADELKEAGADEVYPISGATGAGIEQLLDAVLGYLPERTATEDPGSMPQEESDPDEEDREWSPLD